MLWVASQEFYFYKVQQWKCLGQLFPLSLWVSSSWHFHSIFFYFSIDTGIFPNSLKKNQNRISFSTCIQYFLSTSLNTFNKKNLWRLRSHPISMTKKINKVTEISRIKYIFHVFTILFVLFFQIILHPTMITNKYIKKKLKNHVIGISIPFSTLTNWIFYCLYDTLM